MRHILPKFALIAGLALSAAPLAAEPILGGHYLPITPGGKDGKPLFLAHVFNPDPDAIMGGNLQIGLELNGKKGRRVFTLKPTGEIPSGAIRTFRLPVSVKSEELEGTFRLFGRVQTAASPTVKTVYSESYSFDNRRPEAKAEAGVSLYTEAPPETETPTPPPDIPFEGEFSSRSVTSAGSHPPLPAPKSSGKPGSIAQNQNILLGKSAKIPAAHNAARTAAATLAVSKSPTAKTRSPSSGSVNTFAVSRIPAPMAAPSPAAVPASLAATGEPAEKPIAHSAHLIDGAEFKSLRTIDEELIIYVVKSGDTLKSLAEQYYKDPSRDKAIADLNFIDRTGKLKAGEEIIVEVRPLKNTQSGSTAKGASVEQKGVNSGSKAHGEQEATRKAEKAAKKNSKKYAEAPADPSESPAATGSAASTSAADATGNGGRTYTIQNGDTLAIIAKKLLGKASHAGHLMKANPSLNPKNLKVGTTIVVPAGTGDNA
ncbi:MAG: LysM domain-containing protein [Candidatus Ozemobacteraceae bacterium]